MIESPADVVFCIGLTSPCLLPAADEPRSIPLHGKSVSSPARRIGTLTRALYAAPSYLAAAGLPARPDGLRMHRLVANGLVTPLNRWPFVVERKPQLIVAEGHWRTNDTNLAATMVLQGLGIGRLATLVGDPLVRQKLLVPVLAEFVDARNEVPVFAITAHQRHRLPKIRACIDYWAEWLGGAPSVA